MRGRTLAFIWNLLGKGKTTSLVKIARCAMDWQTGYRRESTAAGAQGVGATEQMARYASILGVPFQALESFDSLNLALQGERWKGLVLIDTPGIGPGPTGMKWTAMARFLRADLRLRSIWS